MAIKVRMKIDKPWRDNPTFCIDFFSANSFNCANPNDQAVADGDVTVKGLRPSSIKNRTVTNDDVKLLCHEWLILLMIISIKNVPFPQCRGKVQKSKRSSI
jgi:hypothetical protein